MFGLTWGGAVRSVRSALSWAYSAAVRGLPSIGDRASVIISVLNTSSGTSSGGGKPPAGSTATTEMLAKRVINLYLVIDPTEVILVTTTNS